ncbi:MAG: hypothetical protein LBU90_02205 [Bacteroidales bacterium]|jgi:hypothetical protein|nr:hypothetical protein [Bacteroidales bacterium]
MTLKKIISIVAFGFFAVSGVSQTNFFANDDDALTKDFYKRSLHYTATALCNFPKWNVGAAFVIHSSVNRISFYFDAKINTLQRYTIHGWEFDAEGQKTAISKSVPYNNLLVNAGIARGVTRNVMLYAAVGFRAQSTDFTNTAGSGQSFTIPRQGLQHNLGLGVIYITDRKFTFQAGMDLSDLSINTGIGYTW